MFRKNKERVKNKSRDQEPTFWEWLIHGKGTVSEPWPTAEELWADPEVQKSIQEHNRSVRKREMDQKNISNKSTESN